MIARAIAFIVGALVAIVLLTVVFGSWYTIDQGERGVILRNGAIVGTADPGLHFKLPMIDSVERVSVQSRIKTYENVEAYSRDQQPAILRLSVNYTIPPDQVDAVYAEFGGEANMVSRLIDPLVNKEFKNTFGQFNAAAAVTDRPSLNRRSQDALATALDGDPVSIISFNIEDIVFSDAYEASIEARMLAEVEVQKLLQNAEREKVQAEILVIQANAKADAVRAEAQAQADATKLRGEAEAYAIQVANDARVSALKTEPRIVDYLIASNWKGALPTTMIPGASVPLISLPTPAGP